MRKTLVSFLAAALIFTLGAASPAQAASYGPIITPEVMVIRTSEQAQVEVEGLPEGDVEYRADNASVASFYNGFVVGMRPGNTVIYAQVWEDDYRRYQTANSSIIVLPNDAKVEFSIEQPVVGVGQSVPLEILLRSYDGSALPLTIEISDSDIARYENGRLYGLKEGAVDIVATAAGGQVSGTARAFIVPRVKATYLRATIPYKIRVGETLRIDTSVRPKDTTDIVEYIVPEKGIVSIDEQGRMTALAVGKVTVFVRVGDKVASQKVYVRE